MGRESSKNFIMKRKENTLIGFFFFFYQKRSDIFSVKLNYFSFEIKYNWFHLYLKKKSKKM